MLGVLLACHEPWPAQEAAGDVALAAAAGPTVVLLSVDGLAPRRLESLLGRGLLPGFARLQSEGAFTHNARTDARSSYTLPNHTSMITGRPVLVGEAEPLQVPHLVTDNYDPGDGVTVHHYNPDLGYTPSVFDVVHDAGGYTSLFAGKSKFLLLRRSYASPAGAADLLPPDDGRNKIDDFDVLADSSVLAERFLAELEVATQRRPQAPKFAMLHVADPDVQGHAYGWDSEPYEAGLMLADAVLRQLLEAFDTQRVRNGLLIVTADHGGVGTAHDDPTLPETGAIPFYVWGEGVARERDLYALSQGTRQDPGSDFTSASGGTPIRNGDAANLALWLLGLSQVPGSTHTGFRLALAGATASSEPDFR